MLIENKPVSAELFFLSSHCETAVLIVEKRSSSMDFNLDLYDTSTVHSELDLGEKERTIERLIQFLNWLSWAV